jgi:hypothetical protein
VARTSRDLPAYTLISDSNTEAVDRFLPGKDDVRFQHALGQVLSSPASRHTILTNDMLIDLPDASRRWRIIVVPGPFPALPAVEETVVLVGIAPAPATPAAGTPEVEGSTDSWSDEPRTDQTYVMPGIGQGTVIAAAAFVLGASDDHLVLAVTPDEADLVLPYQLDKSRRLLVLRSLALPTPTPSPAPTPSPTPAPTRTPSPPRTSTPSLSVLLLPTLPPAMRAP